MDLFAFAPLFIALLAACAAAWFAGRIYSATVGAGKGWP